MKCLLWISVISVMLGSLHRHELFAVDYQQVKIAGKLATVCRVDLKKEHLQLFHRDETGNPLKSFETLDEWLKGKNLKLRFAMNGGMYHGDFSAVGLSVIEGEERSPLNLQPGEGNFFMKPNGVFLISEAGASVVESSEYVELSRRLKVRMATQSGPLLLGSGKIHPVFNPQSSSRLIRNGMGVKTPWEVVFVISEEPVNFYEFARYFREELGCADALFLDGTISSLFAPELKRSDKKMDMGPMIGIVEERKTNN